MRKSATFWAIVLILAGVLLLVGSLFDIATGRLIWPIILIALGVWIIWGILAGPRAVETETAAIPLEGARQARVRIRHGAGRLRVDSSANPGELASGTFGGGLDVQSTREGDALDVEMRIKMHGFDYAWPWMWGPGRGLDWTFGLSREVPLALDFQTGASETWLDLTDLRVSDLRVQTGASANDIILPANAGLTRVKINSGAASVVVRVPASVAARIKIKAGAAGVAVDKGRFPRAEGVYQSPDYDTAANRADIDVETGAGSIEVK
jgi:hypothetical protein